MIAEHVDLRDQVVVVVDLGVADREDAVPEEGHLLFQRPLRVDQVVEPVGRAGNRDRTAGLERGHVAEQLVEVGAGNVRGRVDELLDRLLVALRDEPLQLVARGAKPSAAHQVRHLGDCLRVRHVVPQIPYQNEAPHSEWRSVSQATQFGKLSHRERDVKAGGP